MAYSLINPWKFGIGRDNVAKAMGYEYRLGDDSPAGWWNKTDDGWSRMRFDEGNDLGEWENQFSDAFDPKEAGRQQKFLETVIPTIKNTRSDIWNAFSSAYGDNASKELYTRLGEGFGATNLGVNWKEQMPGLSKFISGPASLFKDAAGASSHFMIGPGSGYLPMNQDDFSGFSADSLGLFLDKNGMPTIGGVSSRPKNHGLGEFATMLPAVMASTFMGSALGGAFPGIDAAGTYMAPGTTGLSISSGLGLDLPQWLSSGLDKSFNSLLSQGAQGKNPLDNPVGLVSPFLKGLDFGNIFGGAGDYADTFNTMADSGIENLSNTFDGGSMGDFDAWDFGPGNMYDYGAYGDLFAQPSGWDFGPAADSYFGYEGMSYPDVSSGSSWLQKLMPSGDSLLKLGLLGLGGALGGVNGAKQSGTTTTTQTRSDVPDWAMPYVQGSLARGAGINATQGYNGVPTDLSNLAAGQLGRTISGNYLNLRDNPQWMDLSQAMGDAYQYGTAPSRASQFARANSLGSTAYAQQKGIDDQAFGRSLAGLAGQIYGQERTNQERASTIAPDWSRAYQQVPYGNEQAYQGLLRGWGGSGTNSSPYYTNPYAGILGGISAAGSLFGKNGIF